MKGIGPSLAIVVLAAALTAVYFFSSSKPAYEFARVERGTVVQEISASGNVGPPTRIELHFKNNGRLESRMVRTGNSAKSGDVLATQDSGELAAQLSEMQAAVDVQKARLAQALAGSLAEDVQLSETAVSNAMQSVIDARQAAIKTVRDAYTKADDAIRTKADVVFNNPRTGNPQFNFIINDFALESGAEEQRALVESRLLSWSVSLPHLAEMQDLRQAISAAQEDLLEITNLLDGIAGALNAHISGIESSTLETWKGSVSAARANVNAAAVALAAESEALEIAEGALASAKDELNLKKAPTRAEDIALFQAQIRQAEAAMERVKAQIQDSSLRAPADGLVTKTGGETGEIVGAEDTIVELTPVAALQVKLNVSENNIADVLEGQKARITLDAFGNDREWLGTVVAIEPAETVVGGAVYYETTILFDADDPRVRSGMTANVWITTATKANALSVPASAIETRENKRYVRVRENEAIQEREVGLGVTGKKGIIEVLSGLSEGEEVVIGERI